MFPEKLINTLQQAQDIVVLTGAGVSAESGIPTFRDALTGLWQRYDVNQLACEDGFLSDPALVWGWYEWRRHRVLKAKPNPAHLTIAKLAKQVPKLTLITQNVDDLHERAGSHEVLHLHGSLHQPRCIACESLYYLPSIDMMQLTTADQECRINPPRCSLCGGLIRPGVVWFGEALPTKIWNQAVQASLQCDLMLIVGTSGLVWPAADLPYQAEKTGSFVVQINPTLTSFNSIAQINLAGKAGELLPQALSICISRKQ